MEIVLGVIVGATLAIIVIGVLFWDLVKRLFIK
jgi:hypothetical protein